MTKPKRESTSKELQKIYYKNILMLKNNKQKNGQGIFLQLVILKNGSQITASFKGTFQTSDKCQNDIKSIKAALNVALRTK